MRIPAIFLQLLAHIIAATALIRPYLWSSRIARIYSHSGDFRSGFVAVLGLPNAGKSTLTNALMKQPLCIVTPKVQTTRQAVRCIFTSNTSQIVFTDTPGIMEPSYKLHQSMLLQVRVIHRFIY
jgi:predicted GTPase